MLVLSRKTSERIHIGDDITVEVRRIAGNRVTLAIEAPRDIRILRGELEKAAKEFDAEETAGEAPAERQTYIVSNNRLPLDALNHRALGHNDMSDHGLAAYTI